VKPGKWLETSAGTHLLVPVDGEAEGQLKDFEKYLGSLPPDLESLILYAIRKPSLDARLRDLEARKGGAAGWVNQIREWSVPILLVLILALNVALLVRTFPKGDARGKTPKDESGHSTNGTGTDKDRHADSGEEAKDKKLSPEELARQRDQKILKVVQAVQDKAGSIQDFADLRDKSFNGLAGEENVAAAWKDKERAELLALGFVKLEALKLGATQLPGDFFKTAKNPNEITGAFQRIGQKAINNDTNARDLLVVLGCLGYGVPGLPKQAFQGQSCKSLPLDKATQGLDDLLTYIESYSPQGGGFGGAS
jgi:hypothetical protein